MDPYDITETLKLAKSIPAMPSLDQLESLMDFDAEAIGDEFLLPDLDEVQGILGIDVFDDNLFNPDGINQLDSIETSVDDSSSFSGTENYNASSEEAEDTADRKKLSKHDSSSSEEGENTADRKKLEHDVNPFQSGSNSRNIDPAKAAILEGNKNVTKQSELNDMDLKKEESLKNFNGGKYPNAANSMMPTIPPKWICCQSKCSKSALYGNSGSVPSYCKKHACKGMIHLKKWFRTPFNFGEGNLDFFSSAMSNPLMAQFMSNLFSLPIPPHNQPPGRIPFHLAKNSADSNTPNVNIFQQKRKKPNKHVTVNCVSSDEFCESGSEVSDGPSKKRMRPCDSKKHPELLALDRFSSFGNPDIPLEDVSSLPFFGEAFDPATQNSSKSNKETLENEFGPSIATKIPPTPVCRSVSPFLQKISMKEFLVDKGLQSVADCICEAYENDMKVLLFSASQRQQFDEDLTSLGVKLYHRRKLLMVLKELKAPIF